MLNFLNRLTSFEGNLYKNKISNKKNYYYFLAQLKIII